MKCILSFLILFSGNSVFGQIDLDSAARSIEHEAFFLYRSEKASWYGTDLFVEKFPNKRDRAGGYFAYSHSDKTTCVFFSNEKDPKVIASFVFDNYSINAKSAIINSDEREFSSAEKEVYTIRQKALELINSDTLFKIYKNTNLNLIPIINNGERKVYVLTGASVTDLVVLGNDYLIRFDTNNEVVSYQTLHKNIIQLNYHKPKSQEDEQEVITLHSHLPETGDFILPTDICTIMLYSKFAKWKQHYVISKNFVSIWDCEKNKLIILTKEAWQKIGAKE